MIIKVLENYNKIIFERWSREQLKIKNKDVLTFAPTPPPPTSIERPARTDNHNCRNALNIDNIDGFSLQLRSERAFSPRRYSRVEENVASILP